VQAGYDDWKKTVVSSDGAGGFLRVRKPDTEGQIGFTVSEGIGYGLLLAVYMNDAELFDNLWKYEQAHLNGNGLMSWQIDAQGKATDNGSATDGDEDMAFALIMADRLWGGKGTLKDSYKNYASQLINAIWKFEIDHSRGEMVKAGDSWGDADTTNISYFAPAYYRVFGKYLGKEADWSKAVDTNYKILEKSLSDKNKNASNGLVPAWCDSNGNPKEASNTRPYFQNDSSRTPFRVGQDYCYFGEMRAKSYMQKITSFYLSVGVKNVVDGYELDGTPAPTLAKNGVLPASFVGPAAVGAMYDASNQAFIDEAYAAVASLKALGGTTYYQKSWTALSLLMLTGNFFEVPAP
jgi:endo-1,4-beta-D-glucanase Y